tara:strand:+ start:153 stop:827 length:675 start_codon:yes stop_codon:yes gene_type:complete
MKTYIQQKQQKLRESQVNFYTSCGIHVFIKEPVNQAVVATALSRLEERLPPHILSEVEMIIFGWFDEFDERDLQAYYDSGTLYVSNLLDDVDDLYETLIHEFAHAVEKTYGYEIYGDGKIQKEFIRKRRHLHDILWEEGYKMPISFFVDTEYNQEFDEMLYKKIGYGKLDGYAAGLFITSYGATSLREYFATAFDDYFMNSNHGFLKKVSPEVYEKINLVLYDQ